jgi:hypothetical protein
MFNTVPNRKQAKRPPEATAPVSSDKPQGQAVGTGGSACFPSPYTGRTAWRPSQTPPEADTVTHFNPLKLLSHGFLPSASA